MLEQFIYINHDGDKLYFGEDSLFVNENDLRDFAWSITSKNNRISTFKKGIVSKTIPVVLKCDSEADGITLRNRLFEVFEKDVLAQKHGKIQIGDYYLRCYITGSKKTDYLQHKNLMYVTLTAQTDYPEWVRETEKSMVTALTNSSYLDYSYDFNHDFQNDIYSTTVDNEDFVPSNFVLKIYGYVSTPTLYINGHKYSVNVTVGFGECLVIDSDNKTIVLTKADGEVVNCFNNRCKDSYIFEKIPSGASVVTSPTDAVTFDLTLLEERSEPKWT